MIKRAFPVGIGVVTVMVACACGSNSPQPLVMPEISTPEVSLVASEVTATGTATNTPTATDRPNDTPMATVAPADIPTATDTATPAATGTPTPTPTSPPTTLLFPLGFMGVGSESSFPQIAASGFNVVQEFRAHQEIDEAEDYLIQAGTAGLYVVQNMPTCRATADSWICQTWPLPVWDETEWAVFISTLATYDNLVAWYLPDEIYDLRAAANLYEWVQRYDPLQRPVYGNPGTFDFGTVQQFPTFSDFLWAACYPEYYNDPRAVVTYGMRLDAAACQGTDVRWGGILQFFDSAEFGGSGGYPTAHALRADSYQAVIAGAKGLWYFEHDKGHNLLGLWDAASAIADEINGTGGLAEVIVSPDVAQTITKINLSGPTQSPAVWGEIYDSVQTLQKEHQGTYLFAVNTATDTVVVEFGNLPTEAVAVEVLFEGRRIPVLDGSFQDSFVQDDVHIYHVITDV